MKLPLRGAIDSDVHLAMPPIKALLPYMSDYWSDQIRTRYIDRTSFALQSYPPRSPLSGRADWRAEAGAGAAPGANLDVLRRQLLEPFGLGAAICHTLHGGMALFNEDMGAEICSAVNRWVAAEWLDHEPRLRASILVYPQNPQLAVAEIERCAGDKRFVSVLLPVSGEAPLGRRIYWPIFEAAERHGLAVTVHAGSTYRHAPTGVGWTSYQIEDYISQSAAFQNLIISLQAEGVFAQFPDFKLVCLESGFTWLPTLLWRSAKTWRGVRTEVPWLDRNPAAVVRERVRLSLRPFDAPSDPAIVQRIFEQIDCPDMLVFSTDYPHWQFEGEEALPDALPPDLIRPILIDNPLAAFPRLAGLPVASLNAEVASS